MISEENFYGRYPLNQRPLDMIFMKSKSFKDNLDNNLIKNNYDNHNNNTNNNNNNNAYVKHFYEVSPFAKLGKCHQQN